MAETYTPEILWAQRSSVADATKNYIYLTISVPDVPKDDIKLDLKSTGLSFTGTSGTLKRKYHVELEFFEEINVEDSKTLHTSKNIELVLRKKELKEEYWPRLLKESRKLHFLKTDFDKWVDEDDQNEAPEEDFSQFGGMEGMPGMGAGGGGGNDFGGIDFSKLGGGAGGMPDFGALGGLGGADLGGDGGDEGDSDGDEEDLPELEKEGVVAEEKK
ncbi:Protein wos2 [Cladobotryum mycophilum]|uniref:Protein wos2 n=1 Tax=Cladobotryum mycophilum TaxID=491253 RepID=A0ABR0SYL7_9HYPO